MGDRSTAQSSPAALPLARAAGVGVRTGALLSVAAGAVVASGQPFLFPSLGPSACATTLIVSLGLLPTLVDGLLVMLSVASLLALREGADAVGVW